MSSASSINLQPQQQHPSVTSASGPASGVAVKRSLQHCSAPPGVTCQLADAELWRRFSEVGNEMIVTKAGRRMFPVIAVSISGLDPDALYSVCVEFHPADDNRYKYVGGQWVIAAKSQLHDVPVPTYWHPEIPNFGAHWSNNVVSFGKLKLTNKDKLDKSQVSLVTLHLYQPVIRIIRVANQNERFTVATFSFPETRFMAVTSYQNEDVTSLKVRYNPFAQKVFQDMAKGRSGGSSNGGDDDDDEPNLSPPSTIDSSQRSTASKMMKTSSGAAVATSTSNGGAYRSQQPSQQLSPPQQSQSRQQPHRPVACQPNLLANFDMHQMNDFSSFMQQQQQPRYTAFNPVVQQPMFDQFNSNPTDCFQFSSMYANPGNAFTSAYGTTPLSHQPLMGAPTFGATNSVPPTSSAAAAAAAYAASYSSSLLSSSLPHNSSNSTFWHGFNLYPTAPGNGAVSVPSFNSTTLSMLTKSSDIISNCLSNNTVTAQPTVATPSTPSGPNSSSNSACNSSSSSGSRSSGSVSLTRLGASSTTTPTLQTLTSRNSDISAVSSSSSATAHIKSSPPESGYCGSPNIDEQQWAACAYQQIANRTANDASTQNLLINTIVASANAANSANSSAY